MFLQKELQMSFVGQIGRDDILLDLFRNMDLKDYAGIKFR